MRRPYDIKIQPMGMKNLKDIMKKIAKNVGIKGIKGRKTNRMLEGVSNTRPILRGFC